MRFFDRQTIENQLKRGVKQKEIVEVLCRNGSLISRKIKNNSVRKKGSTKKGCSVKEPDIK